MTASLPGTKKQDSKKRWALALARRYTRWKAARALDGVRVDGLAEARALSRRSPVVIAANHVSFWDAFVMVLVDEAIGTDGYVLMDRRNLDRLSFMKPLGAIPLARTSPRAAERDLRAAASRLDRPRRAVWIYPQGHQRPHHLRPLRFQRGVAHLAGIAGAPVLPLAIAYHFRDAPQPEARARFGAPLSPDTPDLAEALEARVGELLDDLDRAFLTGARPERLLTPARGRSPEHGIGARLLGRGTHP